MTRPMEEFDHEYFLILEPRQHDEAHVVITWNAQSPPSEWMKRREEWWHWHIVRTIARMVGLGLGLVAVL